MGLSVNPLNKSMLRISLVVAGLLLSAEAFACEPASRPPSSSFVGHKASIATTDEKEYRCTVTHYALHEMYWVLNCENGSKVTIGFEEPSGLGYRSVTILKDRSGQEFKMSQDVADGWREYSCASGIASRTFKIRLTQRAFSFDATVTEMYRQRASPRPPAGF